MLTKLAFRNMRRSIRDYGVYFLTLVFGVSIFYMFNSIYEQQGIMSVTETLNQTMIALREILSIISVFVAVVLGGLIVYANNFFIKRRKKELGIYMTLGMGKRKISRILLLETSIMAIMALVAGLGVGVVGSQFMSFFTASIFEADMTGFKFIFSPDAAMKSILYFLIIFFVVGLFNVVGLSRLKLIDLIYGGRKNETMRIKNIGVAVIIFIISILCLITAYFLILDNGIFYINKRFMFSLIFGIIGTLLFFLSLSGMLTMLIRKNKKMYFKNLNMFVVRQLGSKMNTNFVSISVVCIVLLLVIGLFSSGYSIQDVISSTLKNEIQYDFSAWNYCGYGGCKGIYDYLPEEIKEEDLEYSEFKKYNLDNELQYKDLPLDYSSVFWPIEESSVGVVLLSDYNEILKLQGKSAITLKEEEYAVVYSKGYIEVYEEIQSQKMEFPIDGKTLSLANAQLGINISNIDMEGMYFVVPNHFEDYLESKDFFVDIYLNINVHSEEQEARVDKMLEEESGSIAFIYYTSRKRMYEGSVSTKALISFLTIYLGLVFMICCAAILALQQLSEAADNRERYLLLHKLGADKALINKALFTQILCYFLFPLLLAIVHSIVGLTAVNEAIKMIGKMDVTQSIVITAIVVIVVYGSYFVLTYIGSKNIINKA